MVKVQLLTRDPKTKKVKTAKTAKSRLPKNVIFVGKFRHQLERLHKMTYVFDFFHKNHILEIINFSLDGMIFITVQCGSEPSLPIHTLRVSLVIPLS